MTITSNHSFEALGLRAELLRVVQRAGYARPTPVQAAVIAGVLAGKDVLARASTGTGKTAAFALPLLQGLLERPRARGAHGNRIAVLVLAPTRELALQTAEVFSDFARELPMRIKISAAYGGVSINPQMMELRGGADVLVATPGRLLDLQRQNAVVFEALRTLVLDEADRLLSVGFREEIAGVLALLPARRQTLLFSATFPEHTAQWCRTLLHDPLSVDVTQPVALASPTPVDEPAIEQHVYTVDLERKSALLIQLLKARQLERVLVFVSMKKTANTLVQTLNREQLRASIFHADMSQRERIRTLREFGAGGLRVLIATDLAARGIDDLPVVINFELPRSPNDYLHRVGRTGRAGKAGLAMSLICEAEEQHFRVIEKRMKRRLPREQIAGFEPARRAK
jgi:ATP-dependent RNA helicase RhlE